jgi:hypothetical protein
VDAMNQTNPSPAVPQDQSPEEAQRLAVRRMMLISGLTAVVAIGAVLFAIGYKLFRGEGSVSAPAEQTAMLPKGARIVSTAVAGDRLVVTIDIQGVTEIRTYDARTLKPAGRLGFANGP